MYQRRVNGIAPRLSHCGLLLSNWVSDWKLARRSPLFVMSPQFNWYFAPIICAIDSADKMLRTQYWLLVQADDFGYLPCLRWTTTLLSYSCTFSIRAGKRWNFFEFSIKLLRVLICLCSCFRRAIYKWTEPASHSSPTWYARQRDSFSRTIINRDNRRNRNRNSHSSLVTCLFTLLSTVSAWCHPTVDLKEM